MERELEDIKKELEIMNILKIIEITTTGKMRSKELTRIIRRALSGESIEEILGESLL